MATGIGVFRIGTREPSGGVDDGGEPGAVWAAGLGRLCRFEALESAANWRSRLDDALHGSDESRCHDQ